MPSCAAGWRPPQDDEPLEIDTGGEDGVVRYRRVGRLDTPFGPLTLFWIEAYGGGLCSCPSEMPPPAATATAAAATSPTR